MDRETPHQRQFAAVQKAANPLRFENITPLLCFVSATIDGGR
jgi:hypothetical protein